MLKSKAACHEYLKTETPSTIAHRIKRDQQLCLSHKLPSLLALYLPRAETQLGGKIAVELCPETAKYGPAIMRAEYSGIVEGIKAYLNHMNASFRLEKFPSVQIENRTPTKEDLEAALRVIDFALDGPDQGYMGSLQLQHPIEELIRTIIYRLESSTAPEIAAKKENQKTIEAALPRRRTRKRCYICQFILVVPHSQYPSLCQPCGDFNLASSDLSQPPNLDLDGKTALVTGGRINLGYRTSLRLLRCGAKVIVTSRYPHDAAMRYMAEKDFGLWSGAVKIIGADFRAAKDVFNVVNAIKEQLKEWDDDGDGKLDILINNAAQTWTDSPEQEKEAIDKENILALDPRQNPLLRDTEYQPRVRGGVQDSYLLPRPTQEENRLLEGAEIFDVEPSSQETSKRSGNKDLATKDSNKNQIKCSWFQKIHEIPYEDIISSHSVNTFVPFILIRELLHLMGTPTKPSPASLPRSKPLAYIINVTSREGIFEPKPKSRIKRGHHVHTNLTKAALNMLTETESTPAWEERRVAMNSVDPGYLSAPLETMEKWKEEGRGEKCPIGWEDGTGRVLWPIAVGEKGSLIWGRFLKDYGGTEVDTGIGR